MLLPFFALVGSFNVRKRATTEFISCFDRQVLPSLNKGFVVVVVVVVVICVKNCVCVFSCVCVTVNVGVGVDDIDVGVGVQVPKES